MLMVNFLPGGASRLFGLDAVGLEGTVGWNEPQPHSGLGAVAEAARAIDCASEELVGALDELFLKYSPRREAEGLAERATVAMVESESIGSFDLSRLSADLGVSHRPCSASSSGRPGPVRRVSDLTHRVLGRPFAPNHKWKSGTPGTAPCSEIPCVRSLRTPWWFWPKIPAW